MENECAHADMGRPNLTRKTKFSGANGDSENSVFPFQLTTSRIGNYIRLMPSLLEVMTTHVHTHTHTHTHTSWSFSPVGVITHPGLGHLELTSMLVCGDSSVVSNPLVVAFPGEVLTHRTAFPTLTHRHSGLSPHGSTTAR